MIAQKKADKFEWGLFALGMSILGAILAWHLGSTRVQLEASQEQRLSDQGRIIEENLGHQLEAINQALVALQRDWSPAAGRREGAGHLSLRMASMSSYIPGVRTLFILDRDGTAVAASRPGLIGQDLHDRDYFQIARRSNDPALLHVSSPIRNTLGTYAINLERSASDPQGRFDGLVAATLDPEYFTTLLNSVNFAPDMWSSLAHGDGTLFLIVPDQKIPAGSHLAQPGSLFSRHLESGQDATVLIGRLLATGAWRMAARRNVRPPQLHMDAPLVVAVTRDLGTVYAPWRKDLETQSGLFLLVGLGAGGGLLSHQRRRRAAAQLAADREAMRRDGEQQMRLFFDRQLVGMAITSPQMGWLKVNDQLCRMLGYSREELARVTWAALTHPDDFARDQAAFKQLESGATEGYFHEKRYLRKDGTVLHAELSVGCVRHPDGTLDYVLALISDITERKAAESARLREHEQIEQANQTLESRVQEAVNALREKDQMLISQNRLASMGEMIGNIAHQWRQPLNALSILLANLRDDYRYGTLEAEALERSFREGDRLIQRMSSTISDFKNFFRPDKAMAAFSVLDQVQGAVALVADSFAASGIRVEIEGGEDLQLFGHPNEFSQVLLNLLGNAREAILGQGVHPGLIHIRLWAREGFGGLTVADNGRGIPADSLDRIFEPYFSTRASGTGIGLYMSKQIIEHSMGGRISASNGAEGAEFTVQVPISGAVQRGAAAAR